MKLDSLCDALERLPLPRADEAAHPERDTVAAVRAHVSTAVTDDEFLADCLSYELRLVEDGRLRPGLVPFFVLPRLGVRMAFGHWAPGATPGPREHTAWTVAAVCRNELEVLTFDRDETYRRRALVLERRFAAPAGKAWFAYEPCIHEPRNASRTWALSLHVSSPREGLPRRAGYEPVPGLAPASRPDPGPPAHPYAFVLAARQRQLQVGRLVRVLTTLDACCTLRIPWLLTRCYALAPSAMRRTIHRLVPQPRARELLAGPWLLARTHPELELDVAADPHDGRVSLGVRTPSGRREALALDGAVRPALAVAARELVFDVRALPGPLFPAERESLGEALEHTGLFRRLWQ